MTDTKTKYDSPDARIEAIRIQIYLQLGALGMQDSLPEICDCPEDDYEMEWCRDVSGKSKSLRILIPRNLAKAPYVYRAIPSAATYCSWVDYDLSPSSIHGYLTWWAEGKE